MLAPICLEAPAKLNVTLQVKEQRPDGFHELETLMLRLRWADELLITPAELGSGLHLICNLPELNQAPEANLIHQAYQAFYQQTQLTPLHLSVQLNKQIPLQAGLGGGSSDAACFLAFLNEQHQQPLNPDELSALASQLGSDCPFFLNPKPLALCTGRGEVVKPLQCPAPTGQILMVKDPTIAVPTAWAYQQLKHLPPASAQPSEEALEVVLAAAKAGATLPELLALGCNDFECLFSALPALATRVEQLKTLGANTVRLCGSGSALAATFTEEGSSNLLAKVQALGLQARWCQAL